MITVIIPTIGRKETIERAVKSAILTDTILVSQIIIIDNSQSVDFEHFLSSCSKKFQDSRIEIIRLTKRYSMAQSWNSATINLKAKWIIYLHDDDELLNLNNKTIKIQKIISEHKDAGFIAFKYFCSYKSRLFGLEKKVQRGFSGENTALKIINNCPKFVSTIINVEALKNLGGWSDDYGYFLDLMVFMKMARNNSPVFIDFPIGIYYLHEENESSIEKRATHYGDYIPKVCLDVFKIYKEKEIRADFMNMLVRFVYPEK